MFQCVELWVPSNQIDSQIFAPIGVLCQSSGHGKSRCIKEFSRQNFSIIINLASENDNAYPSASYLSEEFLYKMQEKNSAIVFLYDLINRALDQISTSQSIQIFNNIQNASSNIVTIPSSQPSSTVIDTTLLSQSI